MPGVDTNTLLWMPCTSDLADHGPLGHTVVVHGNVVLNTIDPIFVTGCLDAPGDSGDYLSIADHTAWDIFASNSDNKTVEFWLENANESGAEVYMAQVNTGDGAIPKNYWGIYRLTETIYVRVLVASSLIIDMSFVLNDLLPHHFALVKKANEYGLYLDGVQKAYYTTNVTANFSAELHIAGQTLLSSWLQGKMDAIRIQDTNYFNASPNTDLTDTITVPSIEYSSSSSSSRSSSSSSRSSSSSSSSCRSSSCSSSCSSSSCSSSSSSCRSSSSSSSNNSSSSSCRSSSSSSCRSSSSSSSCSSSSSSSKCSSSSSSSQSSSSSCRSSSSSSCLSSSCSSSSSCRSSSSSSKCSSSSSSSSESVINWLDRNEGNFI